MWWLSSLNVFSQREIISLDWYKFFLPLLKIGAFIFLCQWTPRHVLLLNDILLIYRWLFFSVKIHKMPLSRETNRFLSVGYIFLKKKRLNYFIPNVESGRKFQSQPLTQMTSKRDDGKPLHHQSFDIIIVSPETINDWVRDKERENCELYILECHNYRQGIRTVFEF